MTYHHPDKDFLGKFDVVPETSTHMTEEEILKNMKRLTPTNWKLEGNVLTGQTEMGPLVQKIPTDYILMGTDKAGLPIFKRVIL